MNNYQSDGREERSIEDPLFSKADGSDEGLDDSRFRLHRYSELVVEIARRIAIEADEREFQNRWRQAKADSLSHFDAQVEIFILKRGHKR